MDTQSRARDIIDEFKRTYENGTYTSAESSLQLGGVIDELLKKYRTLEDAILKLARSESRSYPFLSEGRSVE